jgi:nicotinate-nucleotide--dimethylbenzimidazole phosphoribosyltransferase
MNEHEGIPAALEQMLQSVSKLVLRPDPTLVAQGRAHLDTLTKPLGSLGRLEDIAAQLFGIRRGDLSAPLRKAVYVFAADHGVTVEGVSAYPAEVTRQMVLNFLSGGAAINVLARLQGAVVSIVDVGVASNLSDHSSLYHRKVRPGTRNMLHEPAMRWDELTQAIAVGFELAEDAARSGCNVIAPGEMGIGNTTSASALTAALTGGSADRVTGRGAGLSAEAHAKKIQIVTRVLERHFSEMGGALHPADQLRRLGGLEIAAMTGLILGSAAHSMAIVADGFISTVAAALAVALVPETRSFLFAGHLSEEPGHRFLLDHLGLAPLLQLNMRLGEGTGAVLAMSILDAAQHLYNEMATFASAGVSGATA